jgi:hypothetical protein
MHWSFLSTRSARSALYECLKSKPPGTATLKCSAPAIGTFDANSVPSDELGPVHMDSSIFSTSEIVQPFFLDVWSFWVHEGKCCLVRPHCGGRRKPGPCAQSTSPMRFWVVCLFQVSPQELRDLKPVRYRTRMMMMMMWKHATCSQPSIWSGWCTNWPKTASCSNEPSVKFGFFLKYH